MKLFKKSKKKAIQKSIKQFNKNTAKMKKNVVKSWKKSGPESLLAMGILGALTAVLEIRKELGEYCVRKYQIKVPYATINKKPVRVIFVSDLHGKVYGKHNEELIQTIRDEKPDYIFSGGDILTRSEEDTDQIAIHFFKELTKICPVYAANGNHEQRMKEDVEHYGLRYTKYVNELVKLGVHMLENDTEDLDMSGIPATITGLEIPLKCYNHFKEIPLEKHEITERIGLADGERFQILLAHNPTYMKEYAEWGSKLTLSGHLHGGIIRIPGMGGLITPQAKLFPEYSGDMYFKDNKVCVVSRGLGTHTINVRVNNPAEVVVIDLIPKNV